MGIGTWLALAGGLLGCGQVPVSTICATSLTLEANFTMANNRDLDLVFVIDDGPAMVGWQATLATQLPSLMMTAQCAPNGVAAGLHVAVVSSDVGLGWAANAALPGCTVASDGGNFRSQPEAMCADTTLDSGATFISDIGSTHNFTAADDATESGATKVFQCIAQLGDGGCGFGQPLAALDRALGADGRPPPAANAGFLRPDATLGIIFISNQDDCSAPAETTLFSLRDPPENDLGDPRGPLTHYRCNRAGHVCHDPSGNPVTPPLQPPADATSVDGVPTLPLADCSSNESDAVLTPVSKFVADIRSLKSDPDHQILVFGVVGPPTPYAVQWVPEVGGANAGEEWPRVAPSCGSEALDGSGSYGEPAVRLAQFIEAFPNGLLGSICDTSYSALLAAAICREHEGGAPPCLSGNIQTKTDTEGRSYPDCVVTEHVTSADGRHDYLLPACAATTPGSPCWSLGPVGSAHCPAGEVPFGFTNEPVGPDPAHYSANATVSCQLTPPVDAGSCPG